MFAACAVATPGPGRVVATPCRKKSSQPGLVGLRSCYCLHAATAAVAALLLLSILYTPFKPEANLLTQACNGFTVWQ